MTGSDDEIVPPEPAATSLTPPAARQQPATQQEPAAPPESSPAAPVTPPVTPPAPPPPSPPDPPSPRHRVHYAAGTHPGLIRANNEDCYFAGDRLLVVADGMGGHAAGEVASKLVVDALAPLDTAPPHPDPTVDLAAAVDLGNRAIADLVAAHPQLDGMGTTVSALLFDGVRVGIAHVGDSRIYLYREDVLHQLTHDDTFVQSLVDEGRITEQQAHEHPQRNLVLRALTGHVTPPLLAVRELQVGDRFLLCSDGLCGVVGAESIADALAHPDPQITVDTLIQLALAAGGPDNITVIVADVVETGGEQGDLAATAATDDDPSATNPIMRLTREMPRVPLPPIPEEPAAAADIVDDAPFPETDDYDAPLADSDIAGSGDDEPPADGANAAPGPGPGAGGAPRDRAAIPRRRWLRRLIAGTAVAAVLAGLVTAATMWVRTQYFVAEQGNVVVIFRGVNGSALGWRLSTFEETSCAGKTDCTPMKVSDLQPAAQNQVRAGIKAASLRDAREVVRRLETELLPICLPSESVEPVAPDDDAAGSGAGGVINGDATPLAATPAVPGVTCRTAP